MKTNHLAFSLLLVSLCQTQDGYAADFQLFSPNKILASSLEGNDLSVDTQLIAAFQKRQSAKNEATLAAIFPAAPEPEEYEEYEAAEIERVNSTFTVGYTTPRAVGVNSGYTTVGALIFPMTGPATIWPFLQVNGQYFNDNEVGGNVGVGARYFNENSDLGYGLNAYFDWRTFSHRNTFMSQGGIGFEVFGFIDFRMNGYLPFSMTKTIRRCHFDYPGGFFVDQNQFEGGMGGVDAEVGGHFWKSDNFQVYGAIGPYFYGRNQCLSSFIGGRATLLLDITPYITVGGAVSHDRIYKTLVQGTFSINIPLGGSPKTGEAQDMLSQPVRRNDIMVLGKFCKWKTNF